MDPELNETPSYYNNVATSFADIVVDGNGPAEVAARLNAITRRVDFTPHIYAGNAGVLTEITYGTGAVRNGWYTDDGAYVKGVLQVRLGTDADMGVDGSAVIIGLPVEADGTLGSGEAVAIGEHITIGWKNLIHKTDCALHVGDGADYGNGNYAFLIEPTLLFGVMFNNSLGVTSDGAAGTGWHDFHIKFGYFKAVG